VRSGIPEVEINQTNVKENGMQIKPPIKNTQIKPDLGSNAGPKTERKRRIQRYKNRMNLDGNQ
jgi:hypothetical protein